MVHDTNARMEARGLKQKAGEMARQARLLAGIEGVAQLAGEKEVEAARLRDQTRELRELARLEDLAVWRDCIFRGEKKYERWLAGWREGGKVRKVYLGSCRKMDQAEATRKARALKAAALGII
jgi:hypothetical protein